MDPAHSRCELILVHYESDIYTRGAKGDHADVNALENLKDPSRNAQSIADALPDHAHDRLAGSRLDLGEFAEVGQDLGQLFAAVHGERNTDLGSRDHIDRRLVTFEDGEDLGQETVSHQHAGGVDVDERDVLLVDNRLDDLFGLRRLLDDQGAATGGTQRVQDTDWNAVFNRRQHGRRMQHATAEVSQLGSLQQRHHAEALRRADQ